SRAQNGIAQKDAAETLALISFRHGESPHKSGRHDWIAGQFSDEVLRERREGYAGRGKRIKAREFAGYDAHCDKTRYYAAFDVLRNLFSEIAVELLGPAR